MSDESPFREREPITTADALTVLVEGELEVLGRMPYSSNATFLVDIEHPVASVQGIYKPAQGERPLWDFPDGLFRREVAAFLISEQLRWNLVPATVERDGPLGVGSVQLFIPADFDLHYFDLVDDPQHHFTLQRLCVFDYVTNNTDRKGGHCLIDREGHIWAIDHGLSFHAEFKLRTVIWEFGGDPVPAGIITDLHRLLDEPLPEAVTEALSALEIDALATRTRAIISAGTFPIDPTGRRYPWPMI
ncbi:MAG: SCO1664 family protein [Acidimicrobiia bacterium]|nr:SCO1664 family protein [Acidimicrobiia bacterium]